jgi:uncharacterized protein (TIGR02677 family)
VQAARRRLATGLPTKLSDIGTLDEAAFGLFLSLLGEALSEQSDPDTAVTRDTHDGLFRVQLQPLAAESVARITTPLGTFAGRDHLLTIGAVDA